MKRRGALTALWAVGAAASAHAQVAAELARQVPSVPAAAACDFAPALDADFPDPALVEDPATGRLLVFGTNVATADGGRLNVPVVSARRTAPDAWTAPRDALPRLPGWARPGFTWAPALARRPGGPWRLYFTARYGLSGRPCIGVAVSETLEGPYAPLSETLPLACPLSEGGAIDASVFTDVDGAAYLLFKSDANCCEGDPVIYAARLTEDGLAFADASAGEAPFLLLFAHPLIRRDAPWEGRVIEAPSLTMQGGVYALLYSANDYRTERYAVGVALGDHLFGPYVKRSGPLLKSRAGGPLGPGGAEVQGGAPEGPAPVLTAFHGWREREGRRYRALYLGVLDGQGENIALRPYCAPAQAAEAKAQQAPSAAPAAVRGPAAEGGGARESGRSGAPGDKPGR